MTKKEDEYSKDLMATFERNTKPVTITFTAIEIFAIVSTIQFANAGNEILSQNSPLCSYAKEVAKKMHDHLDPESLLSLQLSDGWKSEGARNNG